MSLEDIVSAVGNSAKHFTKGAKDFTQYLAELISHHPVIASGILTTSIINGSNLEIKLGRPENVFSEETVMFASFATYVSCKLIKEYFFNHQQESKSRLENLKNFIFSHPTIPAAVIGCAATLAAGTSELSSVPSWFTFLSTYAGFSALLQFAGQQQELKKNYVAQKLRKNSWSKFKDYYLERPSILSSIAGVGTFVYFEQMFGYGYSFIPLQTFAVNTTFAALAAAAGYLMTLLLSGLFHSQTIDYMKLCLKADFQNFCGRYDNALQTLSGLEEKLIPEARTSIEIKKAEILIKQRKYGEGIIKLKELIYSGRASAGKTPLDFLTETFGISTISSATKFLFGLVDERKNVDLGLMCMKDGKYAIAKSLLKPANDKKNLDRQLLYLFFLDAIGKKEEAREELVSIVARISANFSQMAVSSDEVLEYNSKDFSNAIIFKRSKKSLKKEYENTKLFYDVAADKTKIVQPIACVDKDSCVGRKLNPFNYLALLRIKGMPLANAGEDGAYLLPVLELLAESTMRVQRKLVAEGRAQISISQLDYFLAFKQKFVKRMSTNHDLCEDLYSSGAFIPAYLSKQAPVIIHGNPHSRNIIIGDNKKLCLIDFGDVCSADFGLDVEQVFVDFAPETDRRDYYEHCIDIRSEEKTKETLKRYAYASAFKAAHLLGRSVFYSIGNEKFYVRNLVRAVKDLVELGAERTNAQRFLDAVKHLQ